MPKDREINPTEWNPWRRLHLAKQWQLIAIFFHFRLTESDLTKDAPSSYGRQRSIPNRNLLKWPRERILFHYHFRVKTIFFPAVNPSIKILARKHYNKQNNNNKSGEKSKNNNKQKNKNTTHTMSLWFASDCTDLPLCPLMYFSTTVCDIQGVLNGDNFIVMWTGSFDWHNNNNNNYYYYYYHYYYYYYYYRAKRLSRTVRQWTSIIISSYPLL